MMPGSDERLAVTGAVASLVAALTLLPLIKDRSWLLPAAGLILAVLVTGIVARRLARGWWPAVLGLQVIVLFLATVGLFARSDLADPAGAVQTLVRTLQAGLEVTQTQSPPVDGARGIVLLAAGGAGLVALLVDALAASFRQPALAGLPLLAIYCVPAALLEDGLPWYLFLLAACGFLLLLSADAGDRVRAWGRVLASPDQRATRPGNGTGLARGGRRVAAVAVVLAVAIPSVVPGLDNRLLGDPGDGDGDGGSVITRINPILDMRRDLNDASDTELLRYTTTVSDPDPLRIVTDDEYDGTTWEPSDKTISRSNTIDQGLPSAPGLTSQVETEDATSTIQIYQLRETYLPLPYPTTSISGLDGEWLYDPDTLNVIGNDTDTTDAQYTVDFLDVSPTAQQLADAGDPPDDIVDTYTALPDDMPAVIEKTARRVAGSGTNYEKAVRLQEWFRTDGGFTYDTSAPENEDGDGSASAIVDFLKQKIGYCVHYASTMAVMARQLGIPARVAVGFLPGSSTDDGTWEISSRDAHAWPELYFEGVGWVRFEPTPRSGEAAPEWTLPEGSSSNTSTDDTTTTTTTKSKAAEDESDGGASGSATPTEQESATEQTEGTGGFAVPWQVFAVLLIVLAAATVPRLAAAAASRRRWRRARSAPELAGAAWDDLRFRLSDLGVRWAASWTPRAVRQRLVDDYELAPEQTAALDRLVAEVEDAFYAPPTGGPARPAADRRSDVALVVGAVAARKPARTRRRAQLWPGSGMSALTGLWDRTIDRFRPGDEEDDVPAPVDRTRRRREKAGSGRR